MQFFSLYDRPRTLQLHRQPARWVSFSCYARQMDRRMRFSLYSRWVNTNANVCIHSRRCTNTRYGRTRDVPDRREMAIAFGATVRHPARSRARNKSRMAYAIAFICVVFIFNSLFCHFHSFHVWWTYAFAWMDPLRWYDIFFPFFFFFLLTESSGNIYGW